jgi:hypothetical protein
MYIINPTSTQLQEWFCCGRRIAEYLQNQCHVPLIHKNKNKYYFVKTEQLNMALEKVPLWMKLFENL